MDMLCILPNELNLLILSYCSDVDKIVLFFTSKKLRSLVGSVKVLSGSVCNSIATDGHFELLLWAEKNEFYIPYNILHYASKSGNLEMIEYLSKYFRFDLWAMISAVSHDHVHILEWLKEKEILIYGDFSVTAATEGSFKCLKWLVENRITRKDEVCGILVKNGSLEMLKWCSENKFKLNNFLLLIAAAAGHMDIFLWLIEQGLAIPKDISRHACRGGNLKMLDYLYNLGHNFADPLCYEKATTIETLEWLKEKGCVPSDNFCIIVATSGSLELLKWGLNNGFPYHVEVLLSAIDECKLDVVKWLFENGYGIQNVSMRYCDEDMCDFLETQECHFEFEFDD